MWAANRLSLTATIAPIRAADVPANLAQERIRVFTASFLRDPRPGLLFESDRLVMANDAAIALLGMSVATDRLFYELERTLRSGKNEPDLVFQTRTGSFLTEIHPTCTRAHDMTRICFLVRQPISSPALASLSERERSVVGSLLNGLSTTQIAGRLRISPSTVRKHISHALQKTRTHTRAALVAHVLA
jgi:DNA-binding CsgD family transcriptional regulator